MFFDGQIDDDNAKGLSREIAKHPRGTVTLTVRSPGGDARSAMLLGDAIRQFRVSMIVTQYCHSACSAYLMPSATSVRIENQASIALHGTPSWIVVPEAAPESLKEANSGFRVRERMFFAERGIDYISWLWVQQHKLPLCRFENTSAPLDSIDRYGTMSRVTIVAPSRAVLERLGFPNLQGMLPRTAKEAWEFATEAGFKESISVAFVDELQMPEGWQPPSLTECDEDTTRAFASAIQANDKRIGD